MKRTAALEIEFDNSSREKIREKLNFISYPDTGFQNIFTAYGNYITTEI